MTVIQDNNTINKNAKAIALTFGIINCSIYVILTTLFFISFKTLDNLIDYIDQIAVVTYGSFLISIITACSYRITTNEKKSQVALIYTALLIFNILTLLIYLGLSNMGSGQLFG